MSLEAELVQRVAALERRLKDLESRVTVPHVFLYGTAPPTTGTYQVGEIMINSQPTYLTNQPAGWVYTLKGWLEWGGIAWWGT